MINIALKLPFKKSKSNVTQSFSVIYIKINYVINSKMQCDLQHKQ